MQFSLCQRIGEYPEEGMTLHHKGHHEVEGFRVSRFLHVYASRFFVPRQS